jgi:hypothetical protein
LSHALVALNAVLLTCGLGAGLVGAALRHRDDSGKALSHSLVGLFLNGPFLWFMVTFQQAARRDAAAVARLEGAALEIRELQRDYVATC